MAAGPTSEDLERGVKAISVIDAGAAAAGAVMDHNGVALWHFRTDPDRSAWSIRNLRRKPDFVVTNPAGRELLRIRRLRRLPARFELIVDGQRIGQIERRGAFRHRYRIDLDGSGTCDFRTPLYSVSFRGLSDSGVRVWAWVGSAGKRQWNLLVLDTPDPLPLVTAIAFIHREWWCYT